MAIPAKLTIYAGNTQLIKISGLQFIVPGSDPPVYLPVLDGVVKATLYDSEKNPVTGLQNITLTSIGSPAIGDYVGQVGATFSPTPGGDYVLFLDVTRSSDGSVFHIEVWTEVLARRQ